ncbi:Type I restriction-modification system, restriction subunit R (EC [uncultured Gammaproteobacteria bacterium]|nr:Type I restriction-modification system, restriction subunit R (EC [uncultured Gammaproteobacteria bacterium]
MVNQYKGFKDANYCVRVTANDGEIGEQFLREFQDNEKTIPTVLTTSQKLSTGVDARNIRNIVLMRPVNQIIEFKQIVGRGHDFLTVKNFLPFMILLTPINGFLTPNGMVSLLKRTPVRCVKKNPPNLALNVANYFVFASRSHYQFVINVGKAPVFVPKK